MADGVLLDFAAFFDCFEDDAENFFCNERVARKHRPVLDVIDSRKKDIIGFSEVLGSLRSGWKLV
jgi:hypothetical protein